MGFKPISVIVIVMSPSGPNWTEDELCGAYSLRIPSHVKRAAVESAARNVTRGLRLFKPVKEMCTRLCLNPACSDAQIERQFVPQ